jgi:hypothetical protein
MTSTLKNALIVCSVFLVVGSVGHTAEKYPKLWKKTMVNDASINPYVKKYTSTLSDPTATAVRNIMLAQAVGSLCQSTKLDKKIVSAYRKASKVPASGSAELKASVFLAESEFRMFDYRALAHLCAATDLLFGKSGMLIPGSVKPGIGEPKLAYDPSNPYIILPGFQK